MEFQVIFAMCNIILGSFAYSFLAEFDNSDQVLKLPSTSLVLEVAFSGSNIGLALHHEKNLNMIKSSYSYQQQWH